MLSILLWGPAAGPGEATGPGGVKAVDSTVWWGHDSSDPDWVQGRVMLSSSAADLWGRIQAVDTWSAIFSDITSLTVVERAPPRWRIRVETRSCDCGAHDYLLAFQEQDTVQMRIAAPGVDSLGYLSVRDDPGGSTLVTYRLLVRPQGLAGWFVSRTELRRKQEDMVVRYLRDVRRLAEATPAAAGSPADVEVSRARRSFPPAPHRVDGRGSPRGGGHPRPDRDRDRLPVRRPHGSTTYVSGAALKVAAHEEQQTT